VKEGRLVNPTGAMGSELESAAPRTRLLSNTLYGPPTNAGPSFCHKLRFCEVTK